MSIYDESLLRQAHTHSSGHRAEIESSAVCGCFYCLSIFPPSAIKEWIDDNATALCPGCPVDSVIGDASGFPVSDPKFLTAMHGLWFT